MLLCKVINFDNVACILNGLLLGILNNLAGKTGESQVDSPPLLFPIFYSCNDLLKVSSKVKKESLRNYF